MALDEVELKQRNASLITRASEASSCQLCRLAGSRTTVVYGAGPIGARIMIVGEAPGRDEDLAGQPFVGRSGKLVDRLIGEELGLTRSDCYIANVVKCRPPGNRNPLPDEVKACRPWLDEQVKLVEPVVVITLGTFAGQLLAGSTEKVTTLRASTYQLGGTWIVATFHPAYALRSKPAVLLQMRADFARARHFARLPIPA